MMSKAGAARGSGFSFIVLQGCIEEETDVEFEHGGWYY